ncbi:hypothetical protein K502DRAFT_353211 [Neoconidiobolus thromboides FSU 785]|nr:hypothetical protein K502DRAFT_353211 [Neoconidiobolus thromboides FSU 785]
MNIGTLENKIILNRVNLNHDENITRYQKYQYKAFKIVDSCSFHYKTMLTSIFYLIVISFEFAYRSTLVKNKSIKFNERSILHLVFDILGVPFILLFIIELAIKLVTLTNVKLYTIQLAVLDSSFLLMNIVMSIIDTIQSLHLFLEIKVLVVVIRLLFQVYRNKQVVEIIEKHEDDITKDYEDYYKSMILKYESIRLHNKELEKELEDYHRTIVSTEKQILKLDNDIIETHQKSWDALVPPLLSVKVNIPIMNESSTNNKRKSKELRRLKLYKNKCHSSSNFK